MPATTDSSPKGTCKTEPILLRIAWRGKKAARLKCPPGLFIRTAAPWGCVVTLGTPWLVPPGVVSAALDTASHSALPHLLPQPRPLVLETLHACNHRQLTKKAHAKLSQSCNG